MQNQEPNHQQNPDQALTKQSDLQIAFEDFKQSRLYKWLDGVFGGRFHAFILPLTGFIDAFVIVIPTEAVVAVYVMKHRACSILNQAVVLGLFSALGYGVLYALTYFLGDSVLGWFELFLGSEAITSTEQIVGQYMLLLAFGAGLTSLFPMPATVFALGSGLLAAPFYPMVVGIFLGKALRFGLVAWVSRSYGLKALEFYLRHATWVSVILIVLLVLYFVIK